MIVFDTPGLIDMRSFTLHGVSAKPNTKTPIGYFGTGLKYAMAVLIRLGAEPVVYRGMDKYTFFKRADDFRGVEFQQLAMRRERRDWAGRQQVIDLPFALGYGRNWEAWMAFRELESNTRDEGGVTYQSPDDPGESVNEHTRIVIDLPAFTEAWEKRDDVFLPGAVRTGHGIQVLAGETSSLYWRGLKVMTLPKPASQTYNILDHMVLTEDRTLTSEFSARFAIGMWLINSDDEAMIEKVLTVGDKKWEHDVVFNEYAAPTRAFHNVAVRHPKNVPQAFHAYYSRHDERVVEKTFDVYEAHPLPWRVFGSAVVDKNDRKVFDTPYGYEGKWELVASAILKRINLYAPLEIEEAEEPIVEFGVEPAQEEAA